MLPRPATPKRQGEAAEALFLAKVTDLGLNVAKVWGDSAPYDFIVDSGRRCHRVQVKSNWTPRLSRRQSFDVGVCRGREAMQPYSRSEADIMAIYIAAECAWYVIPIRALARRKTLRLASGDTQSRRLFETYREAWEQLL